MTVAAARTGLLLKRLRRAGVCGLNRTSRRTQSGRMWSPPNLSQRWRQSSRVRLVLRDCPCIRVNCHAVIIPSRREGCGLDDCAP